MESTALSYAPTAAKVTVAGSETLQPFTIAPSSKPTANQFAPQVNAAQHMQYDSLLTWAELSAEWGLTTHVRRDGNGHVTVFIDGWLLEGLQ